MVIYILMDMARMQQGHANVYGKDMDFIHTKWSIRYDKTWYAAYFEVSGIVDDDVTDGFEARQLIVTFVVVIGPWLIKQYRMP